ncbi:sulfotransferase domain-containing protein [Crocosphaera sp.]|uniref:sulfotransferase domain-containing protein n=1 Tax=Crocosphaera sp. TaxID=2729996 RepID=UPI003F25DA52|nr:sulfotransferase domain-containing protein [Crocosphaera sp.]
MRLFHKRFRRKQGRSVAIGIFCHHKAGTVLLRKVFREISNVKDWNFQCVFTQKEQFNQNFDVILFGNSVLDIADITTSFVGVHIIRDPRDIIVSAYLYHRRTSEKWCINKNFSLEVPITHPRVPYSQQHKSEEWKIKYLKSLKGMSYQENLLSMSQKNGLFFEMNNYGSWIIEDMKNWNYNCPNILEIKFEQLMTNYDNNFRLIFEYLGFSQAEIKIGLDIASKHDLGRKSAKEIELMSHVSSPKTSKWKDYFEEAHKEFFINKFGNVLIQLGYENDHNW